MLANGKNQSRYLSVKDAARRLEVHPNFLYQRIRRGGPDAPPFQRIGRFWKVLQARFDAWADQKVIK